MTNQFSANATIVTTMPLRDARREPVAVRMRRGHARIWQVLAAWQRRSRDRAALRSLSPRAIADFCPRQTEAEMEMQKPFWRA